MGYLVCVKINHFLHGPCQKVRPQVASFIGSMWPRATLSSSGNLSWLLAAACLLALGAALHAQAPAAHFSGAQSSLPNPATYPYGVAVDSSGNIFVADNDYGGVTELLQSGGVYRESVSLGPFQQPWGIAVDGSGNLYIAENGANDVIKETLVATPYGNSYTRSVLPTIGLNSPYGMAVDGDGNVYIADGGNGRIVKETPSGSSYTQSTLPTSPVGLPFGVAVDASFNVYITDPGHSRVLKETPSDNSYTESTVADHIDREPVGVAVDGGGNVYILDFYPGGSDDYGVLKETPSGSGYTQSTLAFGPYQNPYGIAADASGDVFLDSPASLVKLVPGAGNFGPVNIGSTSSLISLIFTFDTAGTLGRPAVLTQGATGLDFADAGSGSCTTQGSGQLYGAGDACSIDVIFKPRFSGIRKGAAVLQDATGNALASGYIYGTGTGPQASFPPGKRVSIDSGRNHPFGVAVDAGGNVFFAENGSGAVYKETRSGDVYLRTAVAGGLNHPTGVAVDGRGNLYVAAANAVYKETPFAGSYSESAIVTNLTDLVGITVDGGGNLYVTSSASGDVHKETLDLNGGYTETAIGFGIAGPGGVTVDGSGNIFVTDPHQGNVYKETLEANGSYAQITLASGLAGPESVAVDGGGNLYVTGSTGGEVYKETLQANGSYLQTIAAAGLNAPWGIAADAQGNLYLSFDPPNGELAMIDVSDPPVLSFAKTQVGSTSADSPQLVTVSNIGNAGLGFSVPNSGANPTITASFMLGAETTCPEIGPSGTTGTVDAGSSCVYAINFVPVVPGPVRGSLMLTDNNLNSGYPSYAMQRIELREGITSDATRTTMRVSPNQVKVGLGVTITATVTDTSTLSIVPEGGGVTFTDIVLGKPVSLNGGAPVPLSGGKAVLNLIPRVAGEHTITAHYAGVDASFAGSTGQAALTVLRR
jgi:sugar lactone lactonase YvrE